MPARVGLELTGLAPARSLPQQGGPIGEVQTTRRSLSVCQKESP